MTSLMLHEPKQPGLLTILPAPYRVEALPAVQMLADSYGPQAVRLWILTLSNPGVLYATNPSTLCVFLDELHREWPKISKLIREFQRGALGQNIGEIAALLESAGSSARLARVARSRKPLPLAACAPAVEAVICWTGGYLSQFVQRLRAYLPESRYRLIPMYSISTETVETIADFSAGKTAFLPLAPDVYYEFLPAEQDDQPHNLIGAGDLTPGHLYTMVVSDAYGLRRYQTDDLFLCRGFRRQVPDLEFMRRRSLGYSFTGEKLTAVQVSEALGRIRGLLKNAQCATCVPAWPAGDPVPHYKLVLVGAQTNYSSAVLGQLARCFEEQLELLNPEYRSKRAGHRLGPVQTCSVTLPEFVKRMGGTRFKGGWESQFKFLPLYQKSWDAGKGERYVVS